MFQSRLPVGHHVRVPVWVQQLQLIIWVRHLHGCRARLELPWLLGEAAGGHHAYAIANALTYGHV